MDKLPLNKYISHSGYCSRRAAEQLVRDGLVTVNGDQVIEPGYKVGPQDKISINGKLIKSDTAFVYILLNKPKNVITSTVDPQGRKTVFDYIKDATDQRVFAVGRLDYETTGAILITNDGQLNQQLAHPKYEIRKKYIAKLNKSITSEDLSKIKNGLNLEDGFIKPDYVSITNSGKTVEIIIHSGKNRVVRRIFEKLGYTVIELERVEFAGINISNLTTGKWRLLTDSEIKTLKKP